MKQYLLAIIAVLAAIIIALFSIDTEPFATCTYRSFRNAGIPFAENLSAPAVGANNYSPLQGRNVSTGNNDSQSPIGTQDFVETKNFASLHYTAMATLSPSQLPPLDAGMVNVTANSELRIQNSELEEDDETDENMSAVGYRVDIQSLSITQSELQIAIPYDPALLPQGFTEDDIQTYVYDRQYHRWVAIQRDSVNEAELLVCSRFRPWEKGLPHTQNDMVNPQDALAQVQDMMSFASQGEGGGDSPLDFINAVLRTPEMPETSAYTPTSIKELKAADPLEGLTLMQPPTANNSGTANLSYPIEIPAGRQGMQPNLALTYSSGGGNGWLGVGWDIPIPSITVETRWGVPRYDQSKESEVYVYEGEQLVTRKPNGEFREMPHRTNQWTDRHVLDQDGHEQFFPRKNEAFDSIVRHGDGPANYWWSVTHRNGVTDYYGKYALDEKVNPKCVLRTKADNSFGAIGHWALAESVDPFGNSVRYYYSVVLEDIGKEHGTIGKQIYIDSITYTNNSSVQGKYKVVFNRRNRVREDVIITANRGFAEVTSDNLCNIVVFYNDTTIREYMFFDTLGRFSNYKTRLTDIVRVDRIHEKPIECVDSIQELSGENMTRTHFDYFDSPQGNDIFSTEKRIEFDHVDGIKSWFITDPANLGNEGESSALGSTRGKSWNLGGTASIGLGANVALTSFSVGGNFNYSRSKSEGALTLIDLNGDGLADKLFKIGKTLVYRPQIAIDDTTFNYGDSIHIEGVSDFLKENSSTISWGLQASAGIAYNGSWPTTKSTTSVYFSDVNADGLPDIVTDEGVLFNVTEPGGRVRFSNFYTMMADNQNAGTDVDSNLVFTAVDTCQGIIFDGKANDSIICTVRWIRDTVFNFKDSGFYISPQVLNYVDSLESTGEYYCEYRYWAHPPKVTDIFVYKKEMECLPVFSQTYNTVTATISDPDMETVKVWVPQKEGTAIIRSQFLLMNDSVGGMAQSKWRDGVSYSVQICRKVNSDSNYILHADHYDTLFTKHVNKDDMTMKDTTFYVDLGLEDLVFFRLISGDNHDFDKVSWRQTISFTGDNNEDQYGVGEDSYDSKRDYIVSGQNFFAVPLDEENCYIRVSANIYTTDPYTNDFFHDYKLKVDVLRNDGNNSPSSVANDSWTLTNNISPTQVFLELDDNQYIPVKQEDYVTYTVSGPSFQKFDWSKVRIVPHVEYFRKQDDQYIIIQDYYPPVKAEIGNYTGTRTDSVYHTLFGPLYRGWGQFAYNNNDTIGGVNVHDRCIRVDRLITDMDMYPHNSSQAINGENKINAFGDSITHDTLHPQEYSDITASYENAGVYNPLSNTTSWIEMQPDSKSQTWVGYGNVNYLTDIMMSNTRLPEYSADTNTIDIEDFDHPVPIMNNHEVKTVRKQNISRMKNHSLSLAFVPVISIGASFSSGENTILTDYMDLNGDRFPDIVGQSLVQYSNPWGGIGDPVSMGPAVNGITKSETSSGGTTFGGSFQMPTRGASNNPKLSKISFDGSGNVGANLGGGADNTVSSWMDVNGDGLPDVVSVNDDGESYVSINTGYGFLTKSWWGNFPIRDGKSENAGFDFGANFNLGQTSIGGGLGVNFSRNHTRTMLMDFNGDGLPDIVQTGGSGLMVSYNIGGGNWSPWENIGNISNISFGRSYSESINASVTIGFTLFSILKICVGISGSPYNKTFSRDSVQITDINGDGYPDYVTSNFETEMTVRYNQSGKTNLLRKVTNFTGSTIELDYHMPLACYEKNQRSWNLARVETRNNVDTCPVGGNHTFTSFEYDSPNYNRHERMDYGYGKVITFQYDTDRGDSLYRFTVEEFNNRDFNKRGRKIRDCIYNADTLPYVEHLYGDTLYDYVENRVEDGGCIRTDVYVKKEVDITNWYEGATVPHVTSITMREYDRYRNVNKYTYYGNIAHSDEYFTAEIEYAHNMPHNMLSLPVRIVVRDIDNNILQMRTADYDPYHGRMTTLRLYNYSDTAQYDLNYDSCGNMSNVTMPANATGQRLIMEYLYDNTVHTYPVRVENTSLGFVSSAEYDFRYGKPTKTTDINGNEMWYEYDTLGRTLVITAPYEQGITDYTIRMEYYPHNFKKMEVWTNCPNPYSYAYTYHYDSQHPNDPIRTTIISDGFGRMLQTKKDIEIGGNDSSLVTGKIIYDCFGRTIAQYQPFLEPLGTESVYDSIITTGTETVTKYDIMDRQTYIKTPLGYVTTMSYGFDTCGGHQCLCTAVTDPMGNTVKTLAGTLGQQLKQIAPGNAATRFKYDCLGRLLQSTDPDTISTYYSYDMLGRLIERVHPDAGTDRYHYDAAGNMTAHVNALADSVIYRYHYNQLTDMEFPRYPANNVHYVYGTTADTNINAVSKVILQEDASGWQTFSYGKLGEVTENIRTFALPFENKTYTFKMNFEYDSWNRIQSMTYPDSEVVCYGYNKGGMLSSVTGCKNGTQYRYINSIRYNKFELKEAVWYGNGTQAHYTYDSLQRLNYLQSYTAATAIPGEMMQDIRYDYDSAGNIIEISNNAGMLANGLGGAYSVTYTYDDLYRLSFAEGSWQGLYNLSFQTDMDYHANGRVRNKKVTARTLLNGHPDTVNYNHDYYYEHSTQRNTLTRISYGSTDEQSLHYSWTPAGNMDTCDINGTGSRRFCWDEQNRLLGVKDNRYLSYYQYDVNGDRTFKLTGMRKLQNLSGEWYYYYMLDNTTLYASPYLVATSRGYTKHYYAESERIASKIGGGGLQQINKPLSDVKLTEKAESNYNNAIAVTKYCLGALQTEANSCLYSLYDWKDSVQSENDCYWYHPDHLGSSSWITDTGGHAIQHLHYLPWGEDFVNQKSSSFNGVRFTFSAKERDPETGLSYFGSRYYSSDLSIWLSVDPMSDKYASLSPYVYCADNPVKLVDPNGEYLEVADNDDTHNDLLSIVGKTHRDRVIFNKDGSVSVNMEGLSQEAIDKDIGLSLINDMVNSDYKYYFETSDEAFICDESGARCTRLTACDNNKGVSNASRHGSDSNGGYRDLPMAGFDGQVVIAKSGRFTLYGKDVRKNIVFHELEENYLRTDKQMNYQGDVGIGAHRTAARIENNAWGNFAGQCDYTPPEIPQLRSSESFMNYKNYGKYK